VSALRPFWNCNVCRSQNHEIDGECQFCACGGTDCRRDNCSGEHGKAAAEAARIAEVSE